MIKQDNGCKVKLIIVLKIFRDLRSKTYVNARAESFTERARLFARRLEMWSSGKSSDGLVYLHVMTSHIGKMMTIWGELLNFGYGYFSCTAGEHLNKTIKKEECNHANYDEHRFEQVVVNMRIKQFCYPTTFMHKKREMACSACNMKGHNKKNKCCPMHPNHPQLEFISDDEN